MLEAYGVWGKKSMYGRTFLGVTRATFLIGADGRIARIWPKVKVDGHAAEVLAAAKLLPRLSGARQSIAERRLAAPEFHIGFLRNINHNWLELAQLAPG